MIRRLALVALIALAACRSRPDGEAAEPEFPVRITGQRNVAERDLRASARRELRSFANNGRRPADAADAAYAMEGQLHEKGYAHGTVQFELTEAELVFTVDEGPRTYLGEVFFDRAENVEEAELKKFFAFEGAGPLGAGRPLFKRDQVEAAATEVERYYQLEGHLRVVVGEVQVGWDESRSVATVTVPVEEGPRYTVTEVAFEGADDLPLGAGPDRLVGGPYHVRLPVEVAARVRRILLDRGHQYPEVRARAEIDEEAATVVIRIRVDPGPQVRLREVRFEGNERTRDSFLRNRIPLEEMELVLQHLYDKGLDNLYRTGLFRSVRPRLDRVEEDLADLVIGVEEIEAKTIDFELGYGSYELARGAIRFRDRNIFGMGRRFEVELRGSVRSAGVEVRVEDPYVLGDKNTLEIGAGYLLREEPSFDLEAIDFDLTVVRRIDGYHRIRAGYRFSTQEASDAALGEEEGFIRTAGLFTRFTRDTRDNLLLPTRGSISGVALLWSAPALGAELHFLELDLSHGRYVQLSEQTVFAVGGRFVAREILDNRATLPIQERLFLGGESTVRSFFESELGPVDVDGDPAGGLTSAEAHVELRHRLWKQLHAAAFYDVGIVGRRAFSWEGPPGHAIGVGLRYYFPVGPARLDFGWNPGRRFASDRDWALHLAFGFSF